MVKINISTQIVSNFITNPQGYTSKTPEGAVLREGYSLGIKVRMITGGWVEYNKTTQTWDVFKVCAPW